MWCLNTSERTNMQEARRQAGECKNSEAVSSDLSS
jgi:hypothetical protein